jgi:chemotaxis protein MotB
MPRGKRPEVVKENNERWLLTYADLITLLLAFFVIMYALANVDVKKFEDLKGSLNRAFNTGVLSGQANPSLLAAGEIRQQISEQTNQTQSNMINKIDNLSQEPGEFPDVIQFITKRTDGIAVALSGTLTFVSGSAELTPAGVKIVKDLAEIFRELPNDLRIEGHTDDLAPGSIRYPTNWELSTARAVSIVKEFEKNQIPSRRLVAAGYGDQRPLRRNDSPEARVTNRRAEIVLLTPTIAPLGGPALGPGITNLSGGAL